MSEIKENLLSVKLVESTDSDIKFIASINKELMFSLFYRNTFDNDLQKEIVRRIVKELPSDVVNKIMNNVDLNVVSKLATIEIAKDVNNRKNY